MEKDILRLINNYNGELSWYQLDRALSYNQKHVQIIHRLVEILKDLEQKGLIRSEGEGSQPRYWITDVGRKLVEEQEAQIG
jgi:DNA-binding PadR family transcriptional regulator